MSGYFYPQLNIPKEKYKFDRELRMLLFSDIEKIEVAFRAKMTYVLSHQYDPFWYTYNKLFRDQQVHKNSVLGIQKAIEDSTEDFVIQYKRKYIDNYLPSWMAMEIITFSHLSKIFENLKDTRAKSDIAATFGLPYQLLENWLLLITYSRNICAHHSRFWNRELSLKGRKINTELPFPWIQSEGVAKNRAYFYISVIKYLLDRINPQNSFQQKLEYLFSKYDNIDYNKSMGFPKDWKSQDLWKN